MDKVATGSVEDITAPIIMQSRKEKSYVVPRALIIANKNPPIPKALRKVPMIANMRIEPILRNKDCRCTEKPDSKMINGKRTKKNVSLLKLNPDDSPGILYHMSAMSILRQTIFQC